MLSRVAERMYWAGRYLERAENTARLVKVHGHMLLDLPPKAGRTWEQLVTIFDGQQTFAERIGDATEENVVNYLVSDTLNHGSVLSSLSLLRENVRTTRDIVPTEGWESVNQLYLYARRVLPSAGTEQVRHQSLSEIILRCQQLTGLLSGTMSHGHGYHFMRIGRNLERADMITRVLDVPAASLLNDSVELAPYRFTLWMNVLKSLSGYQMYCQYVRRRVIGEDVIEFLLRDELFPRSLNHCLGEILGALAALPRHKDASKALNLLIGELASLDSTRMEAADLHACLDKLQHQLDGVHAGIVKTWFLPVSEQ